MHTSKPCRLQILNARRQNHINPLQTAYNGPQSIDSIEPWFGMFHLWLRVFGDLNCNDASKLKLWGILYGSRRRIYRVWGSKFLLCHTFACSGMREACKTLQRLKGLFLCLPTASGQHKHDEKNSTVWISPCLRRPAITSGDIGKQ